jgi:hypothetical protein
MTIVSKVSATPEEGRAAIVRELLDVADAFAARAAAQEVCRDRARPGTAAQHVHAHSATLWREAEASLRARIGALTQVG